MIKRYLTRECNERAKDKNRLSQDAEEFNGLKFTTYSVTHLC
jgi:hypothetical protein